MKKVGVFLRHSVYDKIRNHCFHSAHSFCNTLCLCFFPELNKNPVDGFSAGLIDDNDIFRWEVMIIGPPDTYL